MTKFESDLQVDIAGIETLPLLHTCNARTFVQILEDLKLGVSLCKVFNEDLLYTFYGTPSYRLNMNGSTNNPNDFMVCFIIDASNVPEFHKVFPFDTGAFCGVKDVKDKYFTAATNVSDFELEKSVEGPKKIVKTFYENNSNYIDKLPQITEANFPADSYDAKNYANMINDNERGLLDERISSVEIIFNKDIIMNRNNILQIIMPNVFMDNPNVMNLLAKDLNIISPIGYKTVKGNPNEYFGLIRYLYMQYLDT